MGDESSDEVPPENERELCVGGYFGLSDQERKNCICGPVGKWTSWTVRNPARRFTGCRNYKDPRKYCKYFHWTDPELTDYYKGIILQLKEHSQMLKEQEKRMGFRSLKVMQLGRELDVMKSRVVELENDAEFMSVLRQQLEIENAKLKEKYGKLKGKAVEIQKELIKGNGREQVYQGIIVVLLIVLACVVLVKSTVTARKMLPFH